MDMVCYWWWCSCCYCSVFLRVGRAVYCALWFCCFHIVFLSYLYDFLVAASRWILLVLLGKTA